MAAYRARLEKGVALPRCLSCGALALSQRWAHLCLCSGCGRQTDEWREEQRQRMAAKRRAAKQL